MDCPSFYLMKCGYRLTTVYPGHQIFRSLRLGGRFLSCVDRFAYVE